MQNLIGREIYETKISALKVTDKLDGGPIYLKRNLCLHGSEEEIYIRDYAVQPALARTATIDRGTP